MEAVVARTSRYAETSGHQTRIVGLSATLPNPTDVAHFLHVEPRHLYVFGDEYRPVPLQQSFIGILARIN